MTILSRSRARRSIRRALLAFSLIAIVPPAFGAAAAVQPPGGERVDGSNLARVDYEGGWFEERRGGWAEYGLDGGVRFRFEETGRDEWSVYLLDRSRNVAIQLDVHRRMVTYAENGGRRNDLYPITDVTASWQRDDGRESALRRDADHGGKPDGGQAPAPSAYATVGAFYRQLDRPEVMFQFAELHHCHVQNPSQMAAYGGFNQVREVPRLALRGNSTGDCGWPNGFFRRTDEPAVYRLHGPGAGRLGRLACHVVDPRQMALFGGFRLVAVVEQNSDLFRGREQPAPCSDP
jgi:hypothetical protein